MSVKVKNTIEKSNSHNLGADYIKQINQDVDRRCKDAYISQYVEYKNVIKLQQDTIESLESMVNKLIERPVVLLIKYG